MDNDFHYCIEGTPVASVDTRYLPGDEHAAAMWVCEISLRRNSGQPAMKFTGHSKYRTDACDIAHFRASEFLRKG